MNDFKYKLLIASLTLFSMVLMYEMDSQIKMLNRVQSNNTKLSNRLDQASLRHFDAETKLHGLEMNFQNCVNRLNKLKEE